jgi:peptidyl-dipeptidase Dcp
MKNALRLTTVLLGALSVTGCAQTLTPVASQTPAAAVPAPMHPLLASWTGPYGGVPPWDKVTVAGFEPAYEQAFALARAEIDAIAKSPAPPTFDNTIAAMEASGEALQRLSTLFFVYTSTLNTPEVSAVNQRISPRLAAFSDSITQNAALFARVEAVHAARLTSGLKPDQIRLVEDSYRNFVRAGAKLNATEKSRIAAINQQLAKLFTQFSDNVLADEGSYVHWLSASDLDGLPDWLRAAMAAAAKERGQPEKFAITNTRSSMDPFLTYSARRDLREKVWRTFYNRGDNGDATDNNATIRDILRLRAERAKLLGYATHAHWRLEPQMAKTPEAAMKLMEAVWTPAVARAREEVAQMQAIANREKQKITIAPWDYRFYAEKVRKATYDLDMNAVKPYMQLENLREGMFWMANQLFGLTFTQITDVPVYHPDVRVWKVTAGDGALVGLWYFDPYARVGKRSGAWMNDYRAQQRLTGDIKPIVSNNSNFVKGAPGAPVLISWDDAETLFHEFGHALHGLLSNVTYPSQSGTNVARDYVEFPSQLLEHWLATPEILNRFALHVDTGKPIPAELVRKIERASTFRQGFDTVEFLAGALVDMKLHLAGDVPIDPDAFERETLTALGMPGEIVMRHRTPHFSHVFSSDGYSAGYYSYLWSDALTADAAEAFTSAPGGYYDRQVAQSMLTNILAVGNTIDPADGFRQFRGRDVTIDALMRKRGFPVGK